MIRVFLSFLAAIPANSRTYNQSIYVKFSNHKPQRFDIKERERERERERENELEKFTSTARYSSTVARNTSAPALTRLAYFPTLRNQAILATGNLRPALLLRDLLLAFEPRFFPLPTIGLFHFKKTNNFAF